MMIQQLSITHAIIICQEKRIISKLLLYYYSLLKYMRILFTVPAKIRGNHFIMNKDNNADLLHVIADFLELGHVENIVAMFKQDTNLYNLAGELIKDERFTVRLGTAVLFEELAEIRPNDINLAIPALLPLLQEENPFLRGEAATILGIIDSPAVLKDLELLTDDPDPQVREIITDILDKKPKRS